MARHTSGDSAISAPVVSDSYAASSRSSCQVESPSRSARTWVTSSSLTTKYATAASTAASSAGASSSTGSDRLPR